MWTASRLRARLEAIDFRPSRGMGQNFMIDANFVQFLIREANLQPTDRVLEIGPGPGVLTPLLARAASFVLAVELDARLAEIGRAEAAGAGNVEWIVGDALEGKNRLHPLIFDRLAAGHGPVRLISNLPYSIATPVVLNLFESGLPLGDALVTVQKEVAERWAARPGQERYGAVSAHLQALADVTLVRTVPRNVFWPAPRVTSAVARLRPRADRRPREEHRRLVAWIRAAFAHRRKALARNVASSVSPAVPEQEVVRRLVALGKRADARAEELTADEFATLAGGTGGSGIA